MDNIMDEIPCSTIDDEPRFREFLQNAIDEGKIKSEIERSNFSK